MRSPSVNTFALSLTATFPAPKKPEVGDVNASYWYKRKASKHTPLCTIVQANQVVLVAEHRLQLLHPRKVLTEFVQVVSTHGMVILLSNFLRHFAVAGNDKVVQGFVLWMYDINMCDGRYRSLGPTLRSTDC